MEASGSKLSDIIARAEAMDPVELKIEPNVKDELVKGLTELAGAGRVLLQDLFDLISSVLDGYGMGRTISDARGDVLRTLLPDQR